MKGAAVDDLQDIDGSYIRRLISLLEHTPRPLKIFIFAMEHWYNPDGTKREDRTGIHVPNDYIFSLSDRHPQYFEPVPSIHPYRPDALQELKRCYKKGARLIKWLPNSMGMDPADERCDLFYDKMKKYGMVLLSHTGAEHTVDAYMKQNLGNPLRLRRPLDRGVQVVAAHCASEGKAEDLDDPKKPVVSAFKLFLRMMDEEKYDGLLFGDISACVAFKRIGSPLATIIDRTDLHPRLLHGSDYPLPAINLVVHTRALRKRGYITKKERELLNEIYAFNPLLFDFVTKRTLRSPRHHNRFSPCVFMRHPDLQIYDYQKLSTAQNKKKAKKKKDTSNKDDIVETKQTRPTKTKNKNKNKNKKQRKEQEKQDVEEEKGKEKKDDDKEKEKEKAKEESNMEESEEKEE
ncbi:Amidohydrolase [Balamuthia mandrillaris]